MNLSHIVDEQTAICMAEYDAFVAAEADPHVRAMMRASRDAVEEMVRHRNAIGVASAVARLDGQQSRVRH